MDMAVEIGAADVLVPDPTMPSAFVSSRKSCIKSASVHYHFPTKGDLGAALARRYTEEGAAYLAELLATSNDASWCMDKYADIFSRRPDQRQSHVPVRHPSPILCRAQSLKSEISGSPGMKARQNCRAVNMPIWPKRTFKLSRVRFGQK
jgi:hypothetical protein